MCINRFLLGIFCIVLSLNIYAFKNNDSNVGRYLSVSNAPVSKQINPLLAISIYKFSIRVTTVGEAVKHVLQTTGYQLTNNLSKSEKETLSKPLPITDRELGPMTAKSALEVLMGADVYQLQRDPLNRLVNFKVKPSIARALGVKRNG